MIVRVIGFDAAQPAGLRDATSFNQPLNNWNVSNVEDTAIMFYGARSFNQPLNNWNVSTDMSWIYISILCRKNLSVYIDLLLELGG